MTQRNPMNERYQSEERTGKTRKSASTAKPVTKASATTADPVKKTKKQKRAEEREREKKETEKARALGISTESMPTVQYRNYRRMYWAGLIGAIACTAISFLLSSAAEPWSNYSMWFLIAAYGLIIYALYVDMSKIRKLRRGNTDVPRGKSKAARKEQKAHAAKVREREKEAAAAYAAAKENGTLEEKKTFADRVKEKFSGNKTTPAAADTKVNATQAKAAKPKPVKVDPAKVDAPKAETAEGEAAATEAAQAEATAVDEQK